MRATRKQRMERRPRRYVRTRVRSNPALEQTTLTEWQTLRPDQRKKSILFIPVSFTDIRWAAAAYRTEEAAQVYRQNVQHFVQLRAQYLNTTPLTGFSEIGLAEEIQRSLQPNLSGAHYAQLPLGNLNELNAANLDRIQKDIEEYGLDDTKFQQLKAQAILFEDVQKALGFADEYEAILTQSRTLPSFGILGDTFVNKGWFNSSKGSALTANDVKTAALELANRCDALEFNPLNPLNLPPVYHLGQTKDTQVNVYLFATGSNLDERPDLLFPLNSRRATGTTSYQNASLRGIALALIENKIFYVDSSNPAQPIGQLDPNAKLFFGFPYAAARQTDKDPTGSVELINYFGSYRQKFDFRAPVEDLLAKTKANINPKDFISELRVPVYPNDPLLIKESKFGPDRVNAFLGNSAPRPFLFQSSSDSSPLLYRSVEHAFQTLKDGYNKEIYEHPELYTITLDHISDERLSDENTELLKSLMLESFRQNTTARDALLQTMPYRLEVESGRKVNRARNVTALLTTIRPILAKEAAQQDDVTEEEIPVAPAKPTPVLTELNLFLDQRPTLTEEGLSGYLTFRTTLSTKSEFNEIHFTGDWDDRKDKGFFVVSDKNIKGVFKPRLGADGFDVELVIDQIGKVVGTFEAVSSVERLAPSDQFVSDLLRELSSADLANLLNDNQLYKTQSQELSKLFPYAQRATTLREIWAQLRIKHPQEAQNEETKGFETPSYEVLPNPKARPNSPKALGAWLAYGSFYSADSRTDIVIPSASMRIGNEIKPFKIGASDLYSVVTPEIQKRIAYCPYVLYQTMRSYYLYEGKIEQSSGGEVLHLHKMPTSKLVEVVYQAMRAAEKASEGITSLRATQEFVSVLRKAFQEQFKNLPISILGDDSLVGIDGLPRLLTSEQWFGSPSYQYGFSLRRVASLRLEKRKAFMRNVYQTGADQRETESIQRLAESGLSLSDLQKRFGTSKIQKQLPFSCLRLLTYGTWTSDGSMFVYSIAPHDQDRVKVQILDTRGRVPPLQNIQRETYKYISYFKELVELQPTPIQAVVGAVGETVGYTRPIPLELFDSIVFTVYAPNSLSIALKGEPSPANQTPILNETGVRPFAGFDESLRVLERAATLPSLTPQQIEEGVEYVSGLFAPFTLVENATPLECNLQKGRLHYGYGPLRVGNSYAQVALSGTEVQKLIQRYKRNVSITEAGYPEAQNVFSISGEELTRAAQGRQTLIVANQTFPNARPGELLLYRVKISGKPDEIFLLRARGDVNIYGALTQELNSYQDKLKETGVPEGMDEESFEEYKQSQSRKRIHPWDQDEAWKALSQALGDRPLDAVSFPKSAIAAENSNRLLQWVYSREPLAMFDIQYIGNAQVARVDEDVISRFKIIRDIPTLRFNPILALRRYICEKVGLIDPQDKNRGLWSDIHSNYLNLLDKQEQANGELTEDERRQLSLGAPLTILWAGTVQTLEAQKRRILPVNFPVVELQGAPHLSIMVGQMDLPTLEGTNNPDGLEIANIYTITNIASGLIGVQMKPDETLVAAQQLVGAVAPVITTEKRRRLGMSDISGLTREEFKEREAFRSLNYFQLETEQIKDLALARNAQIVVAKTPDGRLRITDALPQSVLIDTPRFANLLVEPAKQLLPKLLNEPGARYRDQFAEKYLSAKWEVRAGIRRLVIPHDGYSRPVNEEGRERYAGQRARLMDSQSFKLNFESILRADPDLVDRSDLLPPELTADIKDLFRFLALEQTVNQRMYWKTIEDSLRNRGFLKKAVQGVSPNWRLSKSLIDVALGRLRPIRIGAFGDYNDIIGYIEGGTPFDLNLREAQARGIKPGLVHTALIDGKPYQIHAQQVEEEIDGEKYKFVRVSSLPYEDSIVRTGNPLFDFLASKGYTLHDPTDYVQLLADINKMKESARFDYRHFGHAEHRDSFVSSSSSFSALSEGAMEMFDKIARTNRSRKPRKARTNPYHRNPLIDADAQAVAEFAKSFDEKGPRAEQMSGIAKAFESDKFVRADSRVLLPQKLQTYFPVKDKKISDYQIDARVREGIERYDLVDRGPSRTRVERIQDPLQTWDQAQPALQRELGLSAEDAAYIVQAQVKKQKEKKKVTIGASAGLCKTYRSKRLMDYELPDAVYQEVRKDAVLIWMSPPSAKLAARLAEKRMPSYPEVNRVMTFRKGDHVDCDLSATRLQEDMTSLLARAIQMNLYWLTEKEKRDRKIKIYVGRVGDPKLYLAYTPPSVPADADPKQPLPISLDAVTATLNEALAGKSGYVLDTEMDQAALNADLDHWIEATKEPLNEKVRERKVAEQVYMWDGVPYPLDSMSLEALRDLAKRMELPPGRMTKAALIELIKNNLKGGPAASNNPRRNPFGERMY